MENESLHDRREDRALGKTLIELYDSGLNGKYVTEVVRVERSCIKTSEARHCLCERLILRVMGSDLGQRKPGDDGAWSIEIYDQIGLSDRRCTAIKFEICASATMPNA